MIFFIWSTEKSKLVSDARYQDSSYLRGWALTGTDTEEDHSLFLDLCVVIWSEDQAYTLIIKLVKSNL